MVGDIEIRVVAGAEGLVNQFHPGFLRRSTCLAAVAGDTGADHIFPGMLTTPITGDDVV